METTMLSRGNLLTGKSGATYRIERFIDSGGQGEVYEASSKNASYAIKWYFPASASQEQKKILQTLINRGAPDERFLWPLDLVTSPKAEGFGYVMYLRPAGFYSIIDLMKRRAEPSFAALCRAAYELVLGYKHLHQGGFSYRDISFKNVFFDAKTGDILICDNDNVFYDDSGIVTINGTPRFMAPEIVRQEALPSRNTDQYSLAVLLFYMFFVHHPLDGARELAIHCMDIPAMEQLYGTHPVFIFDPKDASNRPVRGEQDNPLIYWSIYPESLKAQMTRAFTTGLREPNRRITEDEWLEVISDLICSIMTCPSCGAELFFDPEKSLAGKSGACWCCGKTPADPDWIRIGERVVVLPLGSHLYRHHIYHDFDLRTPAATVAANPRNPRLHGIRNETGENWVFEDRDCEQLLVAPGRSAAIIRGAKLHFGSVTGEIFTGEGGNCNG